MTSLQAKHLPASGLWHHHLPLFGMLFSRYVNGWLSSLHLPYNSIDNCSLHSPQYIPPTLLSALFFFVAFIAIWPCVLLVISPLEHALHEDKHFVCFVHFFEPGHSRCSASVCCMNVHFLNIWVHLMLFTLFGVTGGSHWEHPPFLFYNLYGAVETFLCNYVLIGL